MVSDVGQELLDFAAKEIAERNSITARAQAGQAGAVPAPDTAPLTGGPEAVSADVQIPVLEYVNDWDAPLFNQHTSGSMADITNNYMSEKHGTNGTKYREKNNNKKR